MNKIRIQKLETEKLDPSNIYQLVIEDLYTKEIILYKVKDLTTLNPIRYTFDITELKPGNYKYYLISNEEWELDDLYWDNIKKSQVIIDNGAVTANCEYLVFNGFLLVTDKFATALELYNDGCESAYIMQSEKSENKYTCGSIVKKCMYILNTGIFNVPSIESCDEVIEYKENKKYIEYEG